MFNNECVHIFIIQFVLTTSFGHSFLMAAAHMVILILFLMI